MAKTKKNPFLVPTRRKKGKKANSKDTAVSVSSASVSEINSQVIAEALASAQAAPAIKLCRLCETKDGPFLDIFGEEQGISKKIDALLPFPITECDDLPHKICFRCSAKVEELHDFVQRCKNTQDNLRRFLGKTKRPAIPPKSNTRKIWEEKLNKSNISNDDICNAVIQKAMEGIKNLPPNPLTLEDTVPKKPSRIFEDESDAEQSDASNRSVKPAPPVKNLKKFEDNLSITRTSRQTTSETIVEVNKTESKPSKLAANKRAGKAIDIPLKDSAKESKKGMKVEEPDHIELSSDKDDASNQNDSDSDDSVNIPIKTIQEQKQAVTNEKTEENSKPFNIMDHISIIKVNGVGVLFQCKLCNRNFLKKDVVETHGCAKTGVPKLDFLSMVTNVEPIKVPMASVKYINNKVNMDPPKKNTEPVKTPPAPEVKQKPKIGPASKVKKVAKDSSSIVGMKVKPREMTPSPTPPTIAPTPVPPTMQSIEVPAIPGMKTRYRLVPGPNNTFTLVEDQISGTIQKTTIPPPQPQQLIRSSPNEQQKESSELKKRDIPQPRKIKVTKNPKSILSPVTLSTVIDIEDDPVEEAPYPVGFFTAPTKAPMPLPPKPDAAPATFTTPAMKKQSYTVVQTGNPSKLLISARPQPQPTEDAPKPSKNKRKSRHEVKDNQNEAKKPYSVTLEDAAQPKDNFFTFISIDPLLQPSYVLPTENIIQESQISTSTNTVAGGSNSKDVYECSLCPDKFSREKKLLTHLHLSHYNKMDDDHDEIVRPSRKRSKKS